MWIANSLFPTDALKLLPKLVNSFTEYPKEYSLKKGCIVFYKPSHLRTLRDKHTALFSSECISGERMGEMPRVMGHISQLLKPS